MSTKIIAIFIVFVLFSAVITYSTGNAYAKTYTQSNKPASTEDKKALVEKARADAKAAKEKKKNSTSTN